jgi:hypothetical protein
MQSKATIVCYVYPGKYKNVAIEKLKPTGLDADITPWNLPVLPFLLANWGAHCLEVEGSFVTDVILTLE